jgi:hypothetical protein
MGIKNQEELLVAAEYKRMDTSRGVGISGGELLRRSWPYASWGAIAEKRTSTLHCSWVITVGVATGLRAGGPGSGFDVLEAQHIPPTSRPSPATLHWAGHIVRIDNL